MSLAQITKAAPARKSFSSVVLGIAPGIARIPQEAGVLISCKIRVTR